MCIRDRLDDHLTFASALGIVIVVMGLALIAGHVDWTHARAAMFVALMIGAYTLDLDVAEQNAEQIIYF